MYITLLRKVSTTKRTFYFGVFFWTRGLFPLNVSVKELIVLWMKLIKPPVLLFFQQYGLDYSKAVIIEPAPKSGWTASGCISNCRRRLHCGVLVSKDVSRN